MVDNTKILVKLRPTFYIKEVIKSREVTLTLPKGATVQQLLSLLFKKYGPTLQDLIIDEDDLKAGITLLLNGKNVEFANGLHTVLEDGDVVTILTPAAGG